MPMVPGDIYKHDVDFTALAMQYPNFAKQLKSNRQLDFTDPESVRQLTKALLHRDFNIQIELPEDRLCPPVPNRFNYILFIQNILDSTSHTFSDHYDPNRKVIGLDIGTGSSAIYPLLACRQFPSWLFIATEIDQKNIEYAQQNVRTNDLENRIKLIDVSHANTTQPQDGSTSTLIPTSQLSALSIPTIDILMTNPPFYSSKEEMLHSAKSKSRPPNSSCTGAPVEMIYPDNGEVGFVKQLITESAMPSNRVRIQWFSSMLGKLESVSAVVEELRRVGCGNYALTEFVQGQKTRRWCVAWSWWGFRVRDEVARRVGTGIEKKLLPPKTEFELIIPAAVVAAAGDNGVETVVDNVDREMQKLEGMDWQFKSDLRVGSGRSMDGDVWSRRARRKKEIHEREPMGRQKRDGSLGDVEMKSSDADAGSGDDEGGEEKEPALVIKITINPPASADGIVIHIRWMQGQDPVLFESFCGWLKRKLNT